LRWPGAPPLCNDGPTLNEVRRAGGSRANAHVSMGVPVRAGMRLPARLVWGDQEGTEPN